MIDVIDPFFAFVMVTFGIVSSQLIKILNEDPNVDWGHLEKALISPRFVIFSLVAIMNTGREEMKGVKDEVSRLAKRQHFWERMERAWARGFAYTSAGTAG